MRMFVSFPLLQSEKLRVKAEDKVWVNPIPTLALDLWRQIIEGVQMVEDDV
jgi:hypothetical protein